MKLPSFNPPGLAIKRRGHFGISARVLALLGTAAWTLPAANTYLVHNLVSDLPGLADHQDNNLVNAWGNAFSGTSPFWIGNNGSGTATLYDGTGTAIALVVSIPGPTGSSSPGAVTGVLFNSSASSFSVAAGKAASFLFCTENGTVSGWNNSVDGTHAILMIDNSKSGAVYKGCAIGGTPAAPMMYAANFNSGKIDFWDATLKPMPAAFANPAVPAGFAPFNIQNIGGKLYVTYAKQDAQKHDDVAGAGNGYVAVFDMSGNLVANGVTPGPLNSPWGLAIAPASFGDFAGALLVGNFGDGKINAFSTTTTALLGTLNDRNGQPISIPGLWSINFGNGGRGGDSATLYFTAGIAGNGDPIESHGLLGSIQPAPFALSTGVVNGATFTADALAPNTWVTVQGGALSATTRAWATADFANNQLPTKLNGVGVTINGEPAYIEFVSPSQLNVLVPVDLPAAAVQVQLTNNGLNSPTIAATLQATAPAFFTIGATNAAGNAYIAAEHADGSVSGPPNLVAGLSTTPFKVGETIVLFGTGMGITNPAAPNGRLLTTPLPLSLPPTVTIGGLPSQVAFAGLVGPGLYQINVVIPTGLNFAGATGNVDITVSLQAGAAKSQRNAVISVAAPAGQ
jgi:uncharacterized protein (TIGR03118 family)